MVTRTDVAVEFNSDPRIIEVESPSVEMNMQDLADTLRKQEDAFKGMGFPKLLSASGKEPLGGGVTVGITVALQNLRLAFEGRTTPAETGTVTGSPAPVRPTEQILQDSAALFQTNNVARGSLVINFTDQSIADVISVDSEIQLTTKTLVNGIGNTYDTTDVYHVFNIVQVNATGGNLTAVDEFQAIINAVLPTAFTQVVVTASASATTQNQALLEFATFNGGIYWDSTNGKPSILLSTDGNEQDPLKNLSDVKTQAAAKGFSKIYVVTDAVIGAAENVDGFTLIGETASRTSVTFTSGCTAEDAEFEFLTLSGVSDGSITANRCAIGTLSGIGGTDHETILKECIFLAQTIILKTANNQRVHMIDCSSSGPATTVDVNGHAGELHCHNFMGVIIFTNHTGAGLAAFDTSGGRITLEASVTGTFLVAGIGTLVDNTTSATVLNQLLETTTIKEMYTRQGLDKNKPLTNKSDGGLTATGIDIQATPSGENIVQTRQ